MLNDGKKVKVSLLFITEFYDRSMLYFHHLKCLISPPHTGYHQTPKWMYVPRMIE